MKFKVVHYKCMRRVSDRRRPLAVGGEGALVQFETNPLHLLLGLSYHCGCCGGGEGGDEAKTAARRMANHSSLPSLLRRRRHQMQELLLRRRGSSQPNPLITQFIRWHRQWIFGGLSSGGGGDVLGKKVKRCKKASTAPLALSRGRQKSPSQCHSNVFCGGGAGSTKQRCNVFMASAAPPKGRRSLS